MRRAYRGDFVGKRGCEPCFCAKRHAYMSAASARKAWRRVGEGTAGTSDVCRRAGGRVSHTAGAQSRGDDASRNEATTGSDARPGGAA